MEIWGGVECTVNRVGTRYFDQIERSGHASRLHDLDAFAALGISALRYPALWERTAPHELERADWSWLDQRLGRLQQLGIRPILGLVHHGSGPPYTSLTDPGFADGLAAYARAVAERYPWVEDYTPVNEPVTTARFAGLYGHWYPHGRDVSTFVRALLNQCRGIVLAMREIRRVISSARLVQTEDFGRTLSGPDLAYQAEYENLRQRLSLDLLCGRVNRQHPLRDHLLRAGATDSELAWFVDDPCPPDVIGVNYYVTSDRFLDKHADAYPEWARGGNDRDRYADVAAARAPACAGIIGHRQVLEEAAATYGLPVAITEAHLGGPREQQLRWLAEAWAAANAARAGGCDVRAVTVWSLLGAFDWNKLVVADSGYYEAGVFDVRSGQPRPTALAAVVREYAAGEGGRHPVRDTPGWWRERGPFNASAEADPMIPAAVPRTSDRPVLITGATGTLGQAFSRICRERGLAAVLVNRSELDITEPGSVAAALQRYRPWALINAAGYVRVDDAERDSDRCRRENTEGPSVLAAACGRHNVRLVTFSSDLVFDGDQTTPYLESHPVHPLGVYGLSKAAAEQRVLSVDPGALVVRTSAFFGPWDDYNFLTVALRTLANGRPFRAAADAVVSPTYVPDLVHATLDLLVDGAAGIWHLANIGAVTWADFGRQAAVLAGLDPALVEECEGRTLGFTAARPTYSVLGTERGALLPGLHESMSRYIRARQLGRA